MNDFQVTRICGDKGLILPDAKGFGNVEIRPYSTDFPSETDILKQSAQAFKEEVNWLLAQRIVTIVKADTPYEADELAAAQFEQVIDCVDKKTFGLGIADLYSAGMIKNLDTGWESPRLPGDVFGPFPLFESRNWTIKIVEDIQYILALPDNELKLSILRSFHWFRKAKIETNEQLKCIFKWFSIETLTKTSSDEDISGKILQALGFPIGRIGEFMPHNNIKALQNHTYYKLALGKYEKILGEMREYRNNTVHNGFRQWDIPKTKLEEYDKLLTISVPRIQNYAIEALYVGIKSIIEFWEYYPIIFAEKPLVDLISDFHGNLLFQIANPVNIHNRIGTVNFI